MYNDISIISKYYYFTNRVFQFKYNTLVSEACQIIRDREPGADTGDSKSII